MASRTPNAIGRSTRRCIYWKVATVAVGIATAVWMPFNAAKSAEPIVATSHDALGSSAGVPVSREAQLLLADARQMIARREFEAAAKALEQVLSATDDRFVSVGDDHRFVSAREEAARLFLQMPAIHRQRWEQQNAAAARQSLDAASAAQDIRVLSDIATRSGPSSIGREALRALAALHFDRGRFVEAVAAYRRIVDHPLSDSEEIASAMARLMAAWVYLGESARAQRFAREHQEFIERASLQTVDGKIPLAAWLHRNFPQLAQSRQATGAAKARAGDAPQSKSLPSVLPAWEYAILPAGDVTAFVNGAVGSWKDQGVTAIWSDAPVVSASTAVIRGIDDLVALDVRSGALLWKTGLGSATSRITENSKLFDNDGVSKIYAGDALADRLLTDGVQGSLSTDGERVYGVIDTSGRVDSPQMLRFGGRQARRQRELSNFSSRLVAWDLKNGKEVWSLENLSSQEDSDAASDVDADSSSPPLFVHGPVLCREGMLYATANVGAEMFVLAINAVDGQVQWSLSLADVPSSSMVSLRHRRLACPVGLEDGTLVCTTSAGTIVACDISTRTWKWAYRYARDDIPALTHVGRGRWSPEHFVRWWDFWRHSMLTTADSRVIMATPDSNVIRALDLETGKLLWERPRGNGLFVAGESDSRLIVFESAQVTALEPATGTMLWRSSVGQPSGRGVFAGDHYLQPLQSGELAAIRLEDGAIRRSGNSTFPPLGNLIAFDGGLISQAAERAVRLSPLDIQTHEIVDRLKQSPDDVALLRRRALLDREAGEFAASASIFRRLFEKGHKQEIRRDLRATLLADLREHPPQLSALSVEIESLNDGPNNRIEWLRAVIRAQRVQGRLSEAIETCFRLLGDVPAELHPAMDADESARATRLDRLAWGEIVDALSGASPDQLAVIDAEFDKRLSAAANNPDPFVLVQLVANVQGLRWEKVARERLDARGQRGTEFLPEQLRLFERVDGSDRSENASALRALARLYESHGYQSDAAACFRRLRDEYFDDSSIDQQKADGVIGAGSDRSSLRHEIAQGRSDPWGNAEPLLEEDAARFRGAEFQPLPIEADRGTLFDRVSVYLNAQGSILRFQGDEYRAAWQVNLPETKSSIRMLFPLARGWGLGHLLILRLGTELFAVSVLDERGEPNAKILWTIDTVRVPAPQRGQIDFRLDTPPVGFGTDELRLIDRFGWTCGSVGPVRAAYLCYRDGARLIAIETATGNQLWQRNGVPHDAICNGDEKFVFLARPDSQRLEILRAADGKTVEQRDLAVPPRQFLQWSGSHALLKRESPQSLVLEQVDLIAGDAAWRREFPVASVPFALDARTLGVVSSEGLLIVMSAVDGKEITRHQVDRPKQVTAIHASRDDRRFYVAFSGPVEPRLQRFTSERGEFRNPVINGPLYALDRRSGHVLWKANLRAEGFQLDQLREAPFLILNYRRPNGSGERLQESTFITRLIDKGTGRDLLVDEQTRVSALGCKTVETLPDERSVNLLLPNKTVRLRYTR